MWNWCSDPEGPRLHQLVRQGLSSIERGYDLLAPRFDRSVFRTPDQVLQALQSHFGRPQRALDIGCGTGAVLQALGGYAEVRVGVDLSAGMLERARQCLGPEVELWHSDFLRTHWEESFDLITAVGVMGHLLPEQQAQFFDRVYQSLRPGGSFLTVVGDLRGRWWLWLPAFLFDTLMRLRNSLWRPTFVMYYLAFTLPKALAVVESAGFQVELFDSGLPAPYAQLKILRAVRPSTPAGLDGDLAGVRPSGLFPPD